MKQTSFQESLRISKLNLPQNSLRNLGGLCVSAVKELLVSGDKERTARSRRKSLGFAHSFTAEAQRTPTLRRELMDIRNGCGYAAPCVHGDPPSSFQEVNGSQKYKERLLH